MRFDDYAVALEAIEQGEKRPAEGMPGFFWIMKGVPNADWTAREAELLSRVVPPNADDVRTLLLLDCCLLGWEMPAPRKDAPDTREPFSRERAAELLTDKRYRLIRNSVINTAFRFGAETMAERESAAKN